MLTSHAYFNLGVLTILDFITVWPATYKDYYASVRVSNTESCGRSSVCSASFRVYFTNFVSRY